MWNLNMIQIKVLRIFPNTASISTMHNAYGMSRHSRLTPSRAVMNRANLY